MKMNLVVITNYLHHHMKPLCDSLYERLGDSFRVIICEALSEERIQMKFVDESRSAPYAVCAYENKAVYEYARKLSRDAEVVIIGAADDVFIKERMEQNRLTIRACERYFKRGRMRLLLPKVLLRHYRKDFRLRSKNLHMLCIGAYAPADCRFLHAYSGRMYKWGYFPSFKKYPDTSVILNQKRPASILWTGRLVGWKHPEEAVFVAKALSDKNLPFSMDIVGEGELQPRLEQMIRRYHLEDRVHLHSYMDNDSVRRMMDQAEIYLFTSDRIEGWGVALNEAMNSLCAVVACREIGSAPELVEDGVNGYLYEQGNQPDLIHKVVTLLQQDDLRQHMQQNAYRTIQDTWNEQLAADRLLELCQGLLNGGTPQYLDGPCRSM